MNSISKLEKCQINDRFNENILLENIDTVSSQINKLVKVLNYDLREGIKWYRKFNKQIIKEFDGLAYLYLKQKCLSIEALYYYKKSNFPTAYSLTIECLALNEFLAHKGITSMIFRAAEQTKNIGKIFFKSSDFIEAYEIKKALLIYLFKGRVSSKLYGSIFNSRYLWKKHSKERNDFGLSYFVELVYEMRLNLKDLQCQKDYFKSIFNRFSVNDTEPYSLILNGWLKATKKLMNSDFDAFVLASAEVLYNEFPAELIFLKVILLADLNLIISKIRTTDNTELHTRCTKYLNERIQGFDFFKESNLAL